MSKPEEINAIFITKPVKNTSHAIIKCIGHRKVGDKINDEPLECNLATTKKDPGETYVYNLSEKLYIRFYRSVYTDIYLMTHKTLPVIYCSLMYYDTFWGGLLMNICIEFIIESEIKTEKQLIDSKIEGKYVIVIRINDDTKENIKLKTIDIDEYYTEKIMIDTIKTLTETSEMHEIIKDLLEKRRIERGEKYGSVDDIEIQKPKYNFKDLVNEYEKTGKLCL
jgi:hypothetical protein